MRKEFIDVMLAVIMAAELTGCDGSRDTNTGAVTADTQTTEAQKEETKDDTKKEDEKGDPGASNSKRASDFHIGIIADSVSQSEDGRRGAGAFQAIYGEGIVKLAIYPDNFTRELETIIRTIINLSDDPRTKAIITNRSIPGVTEAFRKIKETRPDVLCIAGGGHEDLPEIGSAANLVRNNNFVARGYLIIHTTYEFGYDTFVHISSSHHTVREAMSRRIATMKETCKESGMKFVLETAPDPTSDTGVAGTQIYILKKVSEWVEKHGRNAACFCTGDARIEPLLRQPMEYGSCSIGADLPSPLMDYPGAPGIDLTAEADDFDKILVKAELATVGRGDTDHFGTWAYPYGCTISTGLAQYTLNILNGGSELGDIDNIARAYQVFSPKTEWNGSNYIDVETGVKLSNVFLVCQDTYIMDDPGYFTDSTKIEVPEKHFTIK